MASLLNMLNNFLGSPGKPSLFNTDSINTTQNIDFNNIFSGFLDSGETGQASLTGLPPTLAGGVDLPLSTAAGNGLPSLLSTQALGIDAPVQLPDAETTQLATLDDGELAEDRRAENALLLAVPAPVAEAVSASTSTLAPAALAVRATPPLDAQIEVAASQTAQLSGDDGRVGSTHTPADNSALAGELGALSVDPVRGVTAMDADAIRPVKLDALATPVGDGVATDLNTTAELVPGSTAEAAAAASAGAVSSAVLSAEGKLQLTAANDVNASTNAANPANAAAPTGQLSAAAPTGTGQTAPQPVDANAVVPATKDPQQFALEQAHGSDAGSDNEPPAEVARQTLLPASPALRPAATPAAPLQAADPNFANVAAMLNQGQSLNSLNERLQFMLLNGQNSAEIQLDPPELGSLQVRVTTRHEQTAVIFVAPNNAVRDALEQQLPRLRDALENAGLQLQDANVFAQTDDKPGTQPQSYADVEAADQQFADDIEAADGSENAPKISSQLVDAYI